MVGKCLRFANGAFFGSLITLGFGAGESETKISRISLSSGQILVGQLSETPAECVGVGEFGPHAPNLTMPITNPLLSSLSAQGEHYISMFGLYNWPQLIKFCLSVHTMH